MKTKLFLLALLVFSRNAAQSAEVLVQNLEPNKRYIIQLNSDGTYLLKKVTTISPNGGTLKPILPLDGTLKSWVAQAVAQVPNHRLKQETLAGLSAAYLGLAKAWREKKITDLKVLLKERENVVNTLLTALNVKDSWTPFNKALIDELNKRKITPDKLADTLEEIAAGFSGEKALNVAVLKAGVQLVLALISKDEQKINTAIQELIVALIGNIGK